MFMMMDVHLRPTRVDFRAPAIGILAWVDGIRVENACQLDFWLNGSILVEDPLKNGGQ